MSKTFKEILIQIATEPKLQTNLLYNLSRINADAMEVFKEVWPQITDERRRMIMKELLEISEVNFEVDFDPIFLLGMADVDAVVRATAIKCLWEYENPSLITPLIHLLKTDQAAIVREAAATALGNFIYMRELEEIGWNEATLAEEALLETIYTASENIDVRRRAIESIGFSSAQNVSGIIENAYYNDNQKVRISAIFAMGRNADARWIPWVIKELDNENAEIRFEAARACGELEARHAVEKLIHLIDEDEDPEVQQMSIWALGRIGGDTARQALEICVDSDNEAIALAAQDALDELNMFGDALLLYEFEEDEIDEDLIDLYDDDLGGAWGHETSANGKDH